MPSLCFALGGPAVPAGYLANSPFAPTRTADRVAFTIRPWHLVLVSKYLNLELQHNSRKQTRERAIPRKFVRAIAIFKVEGNVAKPNLHA